MITLLKIAAVLLAGAMRLALVSLHWRRGLTAENLSSKLDLGGIRAIVRVNGEVKANPLGREAIDNQLQTLAWLANALHRYGRRLQARQRIMTGSFTKPMPIAQGDIFQTDFSDIAMVTASFA